MTRTPPGCWGATAAGRWTTSGCMAAWTFRWARCRSRSGVLGGYVCRSRDLIDYLHHRARPFLFSTSHPSAITAACLVAFDLLEQEPERMAALWESTRYFLAELNRLGFHTGRTATLIAPILDGDARTAHAFSAALFENGLLATGSGFPTVPEDKARIRTIVTATPTRAHLDRALEILARTGRSMGLLRP
jgi:glycine C-acetyltransferase